MNSSQGSLVNEHVEHSGYVWCLLRFAQGVRQISDFLCGLKSSLGATALLFVEFFSPILTSFLRDFRVGYDKS